MAHIERAVHVILLGIMTRYVISAIENLSLSRSYISTFTDVAEVPSETERIQLRSSKVGKLQELSSRSEIYSRYSLVSIVKIISQWKGRLKALKQKIVKWNQLIKSYCALFQVTVFLKWNFKFCLSIRFRLKKQTSVFDATNMETILLTKRCCWLTVMQAL